jgi:ribosomal protein S18 acetylase RimI-like enzyme
LIRRATLDDVDTIARHRAAMFNDIQALPQELFARIEEASRTYFREAVPRGEYLGWLASAASDPQHVVAGAGVLPRRVPPFPRRAGDLVYPADGRQALVLNVYTLPAFRRRGLARLLMYEVMEWARATDVESVVLHAAPDGRALYEALGFSSTSEMRYSGDVSTWTRPVTNQRSA